MRMPTITCTALTFFIEHVPNFGQVYGDPNSDDEDARHPRVPECAVQRLVDAGQIEAPEPTLAAMCDAILADNAELAIEPRALADGETLTAAPLFTVTHVSGPNFDVFGPGMDAPERIKGKAVAKARAAELEAAMAEPIDAPDPDGGWEPATEDAAPL